MGAPFAGARERAYARLDRGQRRYALSVLGTVYVTLRRGRPCLVTYEDGTWVHRYRGATLVGPRIGELPPEMWLNWLRKAFFWGYEPRPGDVVVDVGAGVGGDALVCARLVGPQGRVLAIEAHPVMFRCLTGTRDRNRMANMTCLQLAAWDQPGEIVISDDESWVGNTVVDGNGSSRGVSVPAVTLDEVAREQGIDQIALLKMNIEGAERQALDGMSAVLARTRNAVIACHDFLAAPDDPDDPLRTKEFVRGRLEQAGFAVTENPAHEHPWERDYVYGRRHGC